MRQSLRIAHISDIHFSKLCLSPFQIFSKRWLGTANLLLKRGRIHINKKSSTLLETFQSLGITDVFISGDVTTTSQHSEYRMAQKLVEEFEKAGIRTFIIPGNHDHYTGRSFREKRFYRYFSKPYPGMKELRYSPKEDRLSAFKMENGWWVVSLDTTYARPLNLSNGSYSEELDKRLRTLLSEIPKDEPIILMNHFPFFLNAPKSRCLEGGKLLEKCLLDHPNIKFYLHGHTHRRCLADLRASGLPIVIDCGSLSHLHHGSWNLIDLSLTKAKVSVFTSPEKVPSKWTLLEEKEFDFVV